MSFRVGSIVCIAVLLVVSTAVGDAPQTGVVTGVVKGSDGSPLAGATVQLESERGRQTEVTGADGAFRFAFLVPDTYTVRADLTGFQPAQGKIVVTAGGRADVELQLSEAAGEEIVVTGEIPLVNKYEVATTSTVDSAVADKMVNTFRNYQSLWNTMPGVVQTVASTALGDRAPLVNGGFSNENASFVDGVDVSETRTGGQTRLWLPTTAISEASMMGSGYNSEYGRVVGGVNMAITKSGTNRFHGEFLYVAQNQAWLAQSDHIPLEREDKIIGSYEVSLGGPIVRDKAWFFVAAADNTTNSLTQLADGDVVDDSLTSQPKIFKLHFAPGPSHRLSLTRIDAPATNNYILTYFYDRYTIPEIGMGGDFTTATWNWAIDDSKFLEVRAARQTSVEDRKQREWPTVDPDASPDDPAGNQAVYWDLAPYYFHHAVGLPLGEGLLEYPRNQLNASLTLFAAKHELKLGADYQDVSWETLNLPPDRYLGLVYNTALPGGFARPYYKRVFETIDEPVSTDSSNLALYAQDRINLSDRWTLTAGLRLENQEHQNDVGETVIEATKLAPRVSAIYDLRGDGRLLLKGTAGRYYTQIEQNTINASFSVLPNGANSYDEYLWNPVSRRYDIFRRNQPPPGGTVVNEVEPFYKDEVTAGVEWQFSQLWAFKARAIYWEVLDQHNATSQFDDEGQIYTLVSSVPEAKREYKGLQLELNRRFSNNWVVRANYTLGRSEGNISWVVETLGEARSIVDEETGIPVTLLNRWGPLPQDRTHIFNAVGAKSWRVGKHSFDLGAIFSYRSGAPWQLQETVNLVHPVSGLAIQTSKFVEPRGSHRLPDTYNLNLTGTWSFPLGSVLDGSLRVEVANVTDQQEQVDVNNNTGEVTPVRRSWQRPREFRVVVGLRF